ncbi:MAG: CBS domain-containing protein [Gammaproteobacteria bacterium]|nr:CBS domain-containing protein [Gammaproteobacteria bacterium]
MKTVHEVLLHKGRGEIYSIAPIRSVFEAIEMMSDRHVGALPVMIDDKLVGVVSERDYARKVILRDKSSKQTRVSEIMTQNVVTVTSHDRLSD